MAGVADWFEVRHNLGVPVQQFCGYPAFNSVGQRASLQPTGSLSVAQNSFVLTRQGAPTEVADAFERAHQQSVVRRDEKPDNALVDRHGQPKVSNFGAARPMDALDSFAITVSGEGGFYGPSVLGWVLTETLSLPTPLTPAARTFGSAVDLDGDSLVVSTAWPSARAVRYRASATGYSLEETLDTPGAYVPQRPRLVGDVVVLGAEGEPLELVDLAAAAHTVAVGCAGGLNSEGTRLELEYLGPVVDPVLGYATTATLLASMSPGGIGQVGVFVTSTSAGSLSVGGGTLCLGGPIFRLDSGMYIPPFPLLLPGQVHLELDYGALPFILSPGTSVHFQYWYADPAGGSRGNLTNSVVVTLCG